MNDIGLCILNIWSNFEFAAKKELSSLCQKSIVKILNLRTVWEVKCFLGYTYFEDYPEITMYILTLKIISIHNKFFEHLCSKFWKQKFDKFLLFYRNEDSKKVQNSPLREPNQIKDEPEVSLDSPIKQTKKARKRIESSSDEENGSPKKGNFMQ